MSIHVTDFKWEKGNNDLQYIELLEKTLKNEQAITAKAVAKIRELSVENSELHNEAQAERAFLTERDAEIRATAIEEFAGQLKKKYENCVVNDILMNNDVMSYTNSCSVFESFIDEIAEEMRGAE